MSQTLTEIPGLLGTYSEISRLLDATSPEFLKPLRLQGAAEFAKVGFPTQHDEEFKYISFRELANAKFVPSYGATVSRFEIAEKTIAGKIDAISLTFINGQPAPELSHDHALPEGLWIGTLEDALLDHQGTINAHFAKIADLEGKLGTTNDERFRWLNQAYLDAAMVVIVKDHAQIEKPIRLDFVHLADHGFCAISPRVLIVMGENSSARIIESYTGLGGEYFVNGVTEIYQALNSRLDHIRIQDETREAFHVGTLSIKAEESSRFHGTSLQFGSKIARIDVDAFLNGENTETLLNGVSIGSGDQVIDNHTRIDHAKPNCNSFEVYKTILDDRAHGVFNGKIFVYEDAQKTDAKQTNKAVLLSREATINTKPQLEIFADDVKCTHGATIGKLQDEALFYLRARGIPKKDAEALLVYAFAAEVLEQIEIEALKDALETKLFSLLGSRGT